jgi:hypothetical protein
VVSPASRDDDGDLMQAATGWSAWVGLRARRQPEMQIEPAARLRPIRSTPVP